MLRVPEPVAACDDDLRLLGPEASLPRELLELDELDVEVPLRQVDGLVDDVTLLPRVVPRRTATGGIASVGLRASK